MRFPPPFVRLLHSSTWRRDWFPVLLPPVSPPFPVPPLSEFPASPPAPGPVDLPSLYGVALHCGRHCGRPGGLHSFTTVTFFFCGFVIPFAAFRLCFCLKEAQEGYRIARKTTMRCQSMYCCGLCRPAECGAAVAGVEFFHEFCVQGVWSGPVPASIPCRPESRARALCRSGVLCRSGASGRRPCFSMGRCRPCLLVGPLFIGPPAMLASSPAPLKGCGLFRPPLFAGPPALLASSPALLKGCGLFRSPLFAGPPGAIRCGRGGACCRASCGRCPAAGPPATCCPPWRRAPGESAPPRRRGRAAARGSEPRPARRAGPGP